MLRFPDDYRAVPSGVLFHPPSTGSSLRNRSTRATTKGPDVSPGPFASDNSQLAIINLVDGRVGVVLAVLVDTNGSFGGVTVVAEGDSAGEAVIVSHSTTVDDVSTGSEGGALLATTGTTGDFLHLVCNVHASR